LSSNKLNLEAAIDCEVLQYTDGRVPLSWQEQVLRYLKVAAGLFCGRHLLSVKVDNRFLPEGVDFNIGSANEAAHGGSKVSLEHWLVLWLNVSNLPPGFIEAEGRNDVLTGASILVVLEEPFVVDSGLKGSLKVALVIA